MGKPDFAGRRYFLGRGGAVLAAAMAGGLPLSLYAKEGPGLKLSPSEDLMREHGILRRVLLIYEEVIRRIDIGSTLPTTDILPRATRIVRGFVEDYHEKLEEKYIFPRFRKTDRCRDLVDVLLRQHQAGRKITDTSMSLAAIKGTRDPKDERLLTNSLRLFIRMYRPHAAREDTVLFPALREIVKPPEYKAMGDIFEQKERVLFGENGFEKMVGQVEEIEKQLEIHDLSKFTPMT